MSKDVGLAIIKVYVLNLKTAQKPNMYVLGMLLCECFGLQQWYFLAS